jgi:hypothetical protein
LETALIDSDWYKEHRENYKAYLAVLPAFLKSLGLIGASGQSFVPEHILKRAVAGWFALDQSGDVACTGAGAYDDLIQQWAVVNLANGAGQLDAAIGGAVDTFIKAAKLDPQGAGAVQNTKYEIMAALADLLTIDAQGAVTLDGSKSAKFDALKGRGGKDVASNGVALLAALKTLLKAAGLMDAQDKSLCADKEELVGWLACMWNLGRAKTAKGWGDWTKESPMEPQVGNIAQVLELAKEKWAIPDLALLEVALTQWTYEQGTFELAEDSTIEKDIETRDELARELGITRPGKKRGQ